AAAQSCCAPIWAPAMAARRDVSTGSRRSRSSMPLRCGQRGWRRRERCEFDATRQPFDSSSRVALRLPGTPVELVVPGYTKKDFPTHDIRRFLEPGPIVLVSSAYRNDTNIMTMGWHMVMEFSPSLVTCLISGANHSFELIRKSRQCVINIPTVDLAETVV